MLFSFLKITLARCLVLLTGLLRASTLAASMEEPEQRGRLRYSRTKELNLSIWEIVLKCDNSPIRKLSAYGQNEYSEGSV